MTKTETPETCTTCRGNHFITCTGCNGRNVDTAIDHGTHFEVIPSPHGWCEPCENTGVRECPVCAAAGLI